MDPSEPERWNPKLHEKYWYLNFGGGICSDTWMGEDCSMQRWGVGNCFKSCEQAQQVHEKIREVLLNFHKEHGN